MYLYPFNLVVEGPSDEILLRGAWAKLFSKNRVSTDPSDVRFFPGGNASGACTLYESLITFGNSSEVKVSLIIDGDEAGKKALRGLQERTRYQTKTSLKSNKDFFQLKETIEWLTSIKVMTKLEKERPAQVTVSQNTNNEITSFIVHDKYKKKLQSVLLNFQT
jgi:predicted ATP-dependent endonuclease of OLD family